MLRSRLQSQLQLLALQRLLGGALPSATGAVVTGAAAAAAAAVPPATASAQLRPQLRWFAAEVEPEHSTESARAAHELGLDAVPLEQLKAIMDPVRPKLQAAESQISVSGAPPKQRKLTYQDLQGYSQWVEALKDSPADYSDSLPTGPVVDATQWLEANFKEVGWTMEPRGPFYVWRAWAAAHLPKEQYETLVCVHEVMSDESTRSAFVKQAQHELARLWDWQQRRAALGLSPDLPPVSPAAAAAAFAGSSSSGAASIPAAEPHAAAAAAAAGGELPLELVQAAAAAEEEEEEEAEEGEEEAHSSSSSSDEDAAAAATAVWDPLDPTAIEEFANKNVLDVLEEADALEAAAAEAAAEAAEAAAARAFFEVPDVVDAAPRRQQQQQQRSGLRLNGRSAGRAVEDVQYMLKRGQETARKGQFVQRVSVPLRVYKPVAHDGDIFLPTHPLGNRKVAEVLADPARCRPVNPDKVVQQAAWVVAAAQRASAAGGSSSGPGVTAAAAAAAGGAGGAVGTWNSMPLLDRTVLFEQELRIEAERLAAKPKRALPWQLLDDGYSFDLQTRPPTQTLDLLTSYLEVKYADVLLQKDAVQTINRQLALQTLRNQAGGGFASEVLEQPPAALTAAKTLSPSEREAVSKTLDSLLGSKQYGRYREAVLQLYCDGLVSWGQLQECWAAAQAGEELTAAAEAPVKFADDRQKLFSILSGQQQLPSQALRLDSSSSSSSGPAPSAAEHTAAARQVWEQAASKLKASWAAAGSSGGSSGAGDAWWVTGDGAAATVSYEEAEQTWQQLLVLAGQPDGPRFDQVLLSSSSSSRDDGLEQQLQQLQAALQRAFGLEQQQVQELAGVGSSTDSVGPGELSALQQLFAAPPTLEQVLQQRWQQVSEQELGQELSGPGRAVSQEGGPNWPQMWMLLQQVAAQQQQPGTAAAAAAAGSYAAAQFEKHVREADGVALTPPPYPGARRLLRWEQRLMLHVASGQEVLPAELKVKLGVSAAELRQETGLSEEGLQYLLAVAGDRYNPLTGDLTIACDRFPTREENRRWCLEVLHRLLQVAQGRHPSKHFWVDSSVLGVPAGNPVPPAKAAGAV